MIFTLPRPRDLLLLPRDLLLLCHSHCHRSGLIEGFPNQSWTQNALKYLLWFLVYRPASASLLIPVGFLVFRPRTLGGLPNLSSTLVHHPINPIGLFRHLL